MGRRKSKRKPAPKRKAIVPLDTQFNCPFCNHEKSCDVKMYVYKSIVSYEHLMPIIKRKGMFYFFVLQFTDIVCHVIYVVLA